MSGTERMPRGGGRFRCNYYRMSSFFVFSFLILVVYWAMFTSPNVNGQDQKDQISSFGERKRNMMMNRFGSKKMNNFDDTIQRFNQGFNTGSKFKDLLKNSGDIGTQDGGIDKILGHSSNEVHENRNQDNFDQTNGGIPQANNRLPPDFEKSTNDQQKSGGLSNAGNGDYKQQGGQGGTGFQMDTQNGQQNNNVIGTDIGRNDQSNQNNNVIGTDIGKNDQSNQGLGRQSEGKFGNRFVPVQQGDQQRGTDKIANTVNSAVIGGSQALGQAEAKDKWIILTTIQYPTEDVKFLAKLSGWQVVVAGDTKTPSDWNHPNCHYLSVDKQNELGYETIKLLPTKSYSRKNAAYLYAIAHGARIIYETDDDNRPLDLLKNFIYEPQTFGLKFAGGKIFNPYRHFGQPTLWPRGYPLGYVGGNFTDRYEVGTFKTPSIQQGVVNGDPDMDAIFRLTRKRTNEMLNVSFDGHAPPAILPPGVLVPYNSQNTLFMYDVLWSLVLPTTVTFRVTDIWRGYWTQRLMWEIDANLGFFGPNAFQKRNSHSYVKDAQDEDKLYFQTHDLVDFLLNWKCDESMSFFACAVKLTSDMKENGFWEQRDVDMIKAWFNDLTKLGYPEPQRKPFTMVTDVKSQSNQVVASTGTTNLMFTAAEMHPPMYYDSKYIITSYWSRVQSILKFCPQNPFTLTEGSYRQPTFPEVVLVVAFKQTNYNIIPYLNMLYGSKFPHIVYCGSDWSSYERVATSFSEPFTFVEADVQGGYFNYRCMAKAMRMGYRVSGYMMITSETLLNPWSIETMDRERMWLDQSYYLTAIKQSTEELKNWPAWAKENGRYAYSKALLYISEQSSKVPALSELKNFKSNLARNTNFEDGLFIGPSDVFYIPSKYSQAFATYLEMFSKYNVFHEIVVPTSMLGLELRTNTLPLSGKYLWYDNEKQNYQQNFNLKQTFLHPVKIQEVLATGNGVSFFCSVYLPNILGKSQLSLARGTV